MVMNGEGDVSTLDLSEQQVGVYFPEPYSSLTSDLEAVLLLLSDVQH